MNVMINRLDPHVPDPVESRRRAAGRFVRIAYAAIVYGVIGFFVAYFGAPFVFLSGPGTVSSARYVISLPYAVQVSEKARVAKESLEAVRSYLRVTEEAVQRLDTMTAATVTFRMEVLREHASARKSVISQEAEVAETAAQLSSLDQFVGQLQGRLDEVENHFGKGRVFAPIAGIVSTGLAHVGQSLVGGAPITEILDPTDTFVEWYIPNARLIDPKVGDEVSVLFGNRRIPGTVAEILPVSGVYAGTQQQLVARDRPATQIARIRFSPGVVPPPMNSSVDVRMHYTEVSARIAGALIRVFGLY